MDGGAEDRRRTEGDVPLNPAVEGERANRQNEIGEAGGAIEEGSEEPFGQEDGGPETRAERGPVG